VFLDDTYYPFRANPHFVTWAPLTDAPNSYLVYTPGEKPVLIHYQPEDYWHRPPETPSGFWVGELDIRTVRDESEVARHLPQDREHCILLGKIDDPSQAFGIERVNPSSVLNLLHHARAVKTGYELECMRGASRRAVRGHTAAEEAFRAGAPEYEIHLAYCRAVSHTERELPYDNIVALNENAAVLHYQHQAREAPAEMRSLLVDAGARVNGYASDITRTWSFDSGEFADLIARMDRLQQELVAGVRAGVEFIDLHLEAHRKIAGVLSEAGLASGSTDALIENGVTSAFLPHGLGHLLGIQVHDVGGFMADESGRTIDRPSGHPFLRLTRRLEPDMVLTIEPGLYVIDMLLADLEGTPAAQMVNRERIDRLRPFGGIRIEDNVRVLADGCENLTRDAFAGL
jgi:Xaa-Pro dipeptidase